MDVTHLIAGFGGVVGYPAVLLLLLACGLGVPVPEDIILVSGGYLAFAAGHPVWPMVLTGLAGILGGDSILFGLGHRFGLPMAQRTPLRRYLTEERLQRADGLFHKHGQKIILAARFMPGVRSVTFFSSGAIGVPYWRFLFFDGLAALVSAPLWTILGYRYGAAVVEPARHFQRYILGGLVVLVAGWLLWTWWSQRRVAKSAPDGLHPLPPVALDGPDETPAPRAVDSGHAR